MSQQKRALVTGASSRLGRAMALDLAAQGWDVAIHYHSSEKEAAQTVSEIAAHGVRGTALCADLLDETQTGTLVQKAADTLGGPLGLLINNASIFENDRLETMTRTSWDRGIETNLRAPVRLSQDFAAQAPRAALDGAGEPVARAVIINMIDQRVLKPTPFFLSYSVAKAGLLAFTRLAAQAMAPDIRVAGIGPGPTMIAKRQSPEHFATQRRGCILGRGADPEDIISAMNFILRNKAFTGQMLAVDAGQHLVWKTPDIAGAEP